MRELSGHRLLLTVWKDWGLAFDIFGPAYKPFSFMVEAPGAFRGPGFVAVSS